MLPSKLHKKIAFIRLMSAVHFVLCERLLVILLFLWGSRQAAQRSYDWLKVPWSLPYALATHELYFWCIFVLSTGPCVIVIPCPNQFSLTCLKNKKIENMKKRRPKASWAWWSFERKIRVELFASSGTGHVMLQKASSWCLYLPFIIWCTNLKVKSTKANGKIEWFNVNDIFLF